MTREQALVLSEALEARGLSHVVECGIHDRLSPRISYAVKLAPNRLDAEQLQGLLALADEHDLHLAFLGTYLQFMVEARAGVLR